MKSSQAAVITRSLGHAKFITNWPIPSLRDDDILVRTVAVALNPIDWMLLDTTPSPDAIMGHDYAGTVVAVGDSVRELFKVGDRVCGLVKGADNTRPESGTFAEYIVAKAAIQMKIPDGVSFEDAATVGVGATTAGQCLFGPSCLKLQWPENGNHVENPETFLVYGGATSAGSWIIQFAKLAGYSVLTTCSPNNFDLVRQYGADVVFDYRDPTCARKIREYTNNTLRLVCDAVATQESVRICEAAMGDAGGLYHSLLPVRTSRSDVQATFSNCCTAIGEPFEYGPERMVIPGMPAEFEFAKKWAGIVSNLWAQGKIRTLVVEKRDGGLRKVLDGLKDLKNRSVRARKLVFLISET
ncbi:protein TOXD [Aspergillus lentulus]|uniref:Protein TOXD n=1 Tax=Aspergillus lentulus TaxID=293939 RepID=A0AAN4PSF3_ASPLE|nr:protein TOXD [Aspergillus lentulus]